MGDPMKRARGRRAAAAKAEGNGSGPAHDLIPADPDDVPEFLRGDAWEGPSGSGSFPIGERTETESRGDPFPPPIPASQLRKASEERLWVWDGCIPRGGIALLTALWKAGKTTLLAYLLKAMGEGGEFCGRAVAAGRVLYVTEESESRWAERRDELGLGDHVSFQVRPFMVKPRVADWHGLIDHLAALQRRQPADLLILDTIGNLWPVKDENDAAQVQAALMPLHRLTASAGLLALHHPRKGDGQEATASRGSGALPAFVDVILELRRYDPKSKTDRRRVITGYGRWDDIPQEVVIELAADGAGYTAHGDKRQVAGKELRAELFKALPTDPPGLDTDAVLKALPDEAKPRRQTLLAELNRGAEANPPDWRREGRGVKGSPFTYWVEAFP